jgi:hypothetical protein
MTRQMTQTRGSRVWLFLKINIRFKWLVSFFGDSVPPLLQGTTEHGTAAKDTTHQIKRCVINAKGSWKRKRRENKFTFIWVALLPPLNLSNFNWPNWPSWHMTQTIACRVIPTATAALNNILGQHSPNVSTILLRLFLLRFFPKPIRMLYNSCKLAGVLGQLKQELNSSETSCDN